MSDPNDQLQAAIVQALKSPGALPEVVGGRVFDQAPATAAFPYVTLTQSQVVSDKADGIDAVDVTNQIDVWSRNVGYPEASLIADAIVSALDGVVLSVEGYELVLIEHESTQYSHDPDGITRRAMLLFHSVLTKA